MRIVGGTHRGRTIASPKGDAVRPTSDRNRLAIFNALNHRGAVVDAVVIDAFCGTGALGLEALSQGASKVLFMDTARASLDLARGNATALGLETLCAFRLADASKLAPAGPETGLATLVFLDPPYRKNLVVPTLDALKSGGYLAPDAWVVVESEKGMTLGAYERFVESERHYGDTGIRFLTGL